MLLLEGGSGRGAVGGLVGQTSCLLGDGDPNAGWYHMDVVLRNALPEPQQRYPEFALCASIESGVS